MRKIKLEQLIKQHETMIEIIRADMDEEYDPVKRNELLNEIKEHEDVILILTNRLNK